MPTKDKVLSKVFGDPQKKIVRRLQKRVDEINALSDKYAQMTDAELAKQTAILRDRVAEIERRHALASAKTTKNTKSAHNDVLANNAATRVKTNKLSGSARERYAKVGTASIDDFNAIDAIRARHAAARRKDALNEVLPDAFALVREMSTRVLGQRHYDVQLMGGIVLHEGNIAEMRTGEGKTLVATAPIYLNALTGRGVHMVTVNDYLAQLHGGWMGKLYHALGLSTGVIINEQSFIYDPEYENTDHFDKRMSHLKPCSRKEAYAADITYGTNNEFGFDYLRDNMVSDPNLLRQRELNFAIVDEVDSILIDEARTPLIISAPAAENPDLYIKFAAIVAQLDAPSRVITKHGLINPFTGNPIDPSEADEEPDGDYEVDEKRHSVALTDQGVEKVERLLGIKNLFSPEHIRSVYHLDQALKARALFKRDKDYVVTTDGEVVIVDEFTGRLMQGRRYSEGLHQAIEAKEHVAVRQESQTLATISFQNYFRLYDKLSGMTGTAFTEAEEFQQIYGLDVIQIPTNRTPQRKDHQDMIFKTERAKINYIVKMVKTYHDQGRPVLIGSASIAKNELISAALDKAGLKHETLNAKNNEREAEIIARAGQPGAITLATNIAGRGTDIMLGKGVAEKGGLVVIGSERHESRRIDNQLRGRCGRQGDPGDTYFCVSTEDDLMRIYQGERIAETMERMGFPDDVPLKNRALTKILEAAQKRVEGFSFDTRKNVVQYDNVINRHRKVVYSIRRKILQGDDISPEILRLADAFVTKLFKRYTKRPAKIVEQFIDVFGIDEDTALKIAQIKSDRKRLISARQAVLALYDAKEDELGSELLHGAEREIYMQVIDVLWMQHLENMQHLREGIHWRSVGQRDPLVEYRMESQKLFESLQHTLQLEVLSVIFSLKRAAVNADQVTDDTYDSDLTKAAASAVEHGVNETTSGESLSSDDFKAKPAKPAVRRSTQKRNKQERQNRKRGRR